MNLVNVGGDLNIDSPHASGKGSTAAGRDAASGGSTIAHDSEIANAAADSAAATGGSTSASAARPPRGRKGKPILAIVFGVVLIVAIGLLIAGIDLALVGVVIAAAGLALEIAKLAKGG